MQIKSHTPPIQLIQKQRNTWLLYSPKCKLFHSILPGGKQTDCLERRQWDQILCETEKCIALVTSNRAVKVALRERVGGWRIMGYVECIKRNSLQLLYCTMVYSTIQRRCCSSHQLSITIFTASSDCRAACEGRRGMLMWIYYIPKIQTKKLW